MAPLGGVVEWELEEGDGCERIARRYRNMQWMVLIFTTDYTSPPFVFTTFHHILPSLCCKSP